MSEFTKGPWELEETEDGHVIRMGKAIDNYSEFPSHMEIEYNHGCLLDGEDGDAFRDAEITQAGEALVNAQLIASAPEMYEALQRALRFITNGVEMGYIILPDVDSGDSALETPNIICLALEKARGRVAK